MLVFFFRWAMPIVRADALSGQIVLDLVDFMFLSGCLVLFSVLNNPRAGGIPFPLPIPNREVKPCSTDGTGVTPGRVGRRHIIIDPAPKDAGFFFSMGDAHR